MTTAAKIFSTNNARWYSSAGEPVYEIAKKDGKGMRAPTLADARKQNYLPSVTTIIDAVLRKPALESWKMEQACLAVLTAPRQNGEELDAFVRRVLVEEQQQNQESQIAKDRGTAIHKALEDYMQGQAVESELLPWIEPAAKAVMARGARVTSEKILVGDGYAGKTDLILEAFEWWEIIDWKTTKRLPDKGAYSEHIIQCATYAAAFEKIIQADGQSKPVRTANCYVSTTEKGKFVICEHDPNWRTAYACGFVPLLTVWQYLNSYRAQQ